MTAPIVTAPPALLDVARRNGRVDLSSVSSVCSTADSWPEGTRNNRMFSTLVRYAEDDFALDEVERLGLDLNRRKCNPPLSDYEVAEIAASAVRTAERVGTRDRPQKVHTHGLKKPSRKKTSTVYERPQKMAPEAFHGIAGEYVRAVEPGTEAQGEAILVAVLTLAGVAVGNGPHFVIGATRHPCTIFSVLVGDTSRARKGTALAEAARLIRAAAPDLEIARGLSSGEGFIDMFRDDNAGADDFRNPDVRRAVIEDEYASVLRVMGRETNILSAVLRNAWDGLKLGTITRHNPRFVSSHHAGIVGAVTEDELRRDMSPVAITNGLVNRNLWCCTHRPRVLPSPPPPINLDGFTGRLADTFKLAIFDRKPKPHTDAYAALWREIYPDLTAEHPGAFGAAIARAEAQVQRLALIFAVLDRAKARDEEHLRAALAVWDYCEQSAAYIFATGTGDPLADRILAGLRGSPEGLTRTRIRELVGNRVDGDRITRALDRLAEHGHAARSTQETDGRPAERWEATR